MQIILPKIFFLPESYFLNYISKNINLHKSSLSTYNNTIIMYLSNYEYICFY